MFGLSCFADGLVLGPAEGLLLVLLVTVGRLHKRFPKIIIALNMFLRKGSMSLVIEPIYRSGQWC